MVDRANDIKIVPNIPVTIDVRVLNIYPGKAKAGKKPRARLMVKGDQVAEVGGITDGVLFVDAANALRELRAAGVVDPVDYDSENGIPDKGIRVDIKVPKPCRLVFLAEQLAGARYPTLRISRPGAAQAPSPEKAARPVNASPATRTTPESAPVQRSAARGTAPALDQSGDGKRARAATYERLTRYAIKHVVPIYAEAGIECDARAIAAIVDGLYKVEVWQVA